MRPLIPRFDDPNDPAAKKYLEWLATQGEDSPGLGPSLLPPELHPIATHGLAPSVPQSPRTRLPDAAPSDIAGEYYARLERDRGKAGDEEGVAFAQAMAEKYAPKQAETEGEATEGEEGDAKPAEAPALARPEFSRSTFADGRRRPDASTQIGGVSALQDRKRSGLPFDLSGVANVGGMFLSLLADREINKGRGGERILEQFDPERLDDRALDHRYKEAQIHNLMNPRSRGMSDEQLELQRLRIAQADRRLGNQEAGAQAKLDYQQALGELDSSVTLAKQEAAIAAGYDPAEVRKMTGEQLNWIRVQMGQEAAQARGFENQKHLLGIREGLDIRGEQRAEQRDERKEGRAIEREQIESEAERTTDVIGQVNNIDSLISSLSKLNPRAPLTTHAPLPAKLYREVSKAVFGGKGISADEATAEQAVLMSGFARFRDITGQVANTVGEQVMVADIFAGDGTVGSALANAKRVRAKLVREHNQIIRAQRRIKSKAPGRAAAPAVKTVKVQDPKTGRTITTDDTPEVRKRIDAGLLKVVP